MSNPQPSPTLSFGNAVTVLMEACNIAADARSAFDARIRHLQKLGVPARGKEDVARFRYGISELAALATAVRLMDTFMPPALAARYVIERWTELAPFVLAGAREALPQGYLSRRTIPTETFAVFRANALAMLGKRRQHDERGDEPLGSIRICDEASATGLTSAIDGAGLVIDSRIYMPVIAYRWAKLIAATDAEVSNELDRLRFVG